MDSEHVEARSNDVVRRAKEAATEVVSRFDKQLKRNPYSMLGVACVIGAGVGIVLSSRILRAAITAGALEITRAFVQKYVFRVEATSAPA